MTKCVGLVFLLLMTTSFSFSLLMGKGGEEVA